ncbi:DUF2946 family protein [Hyphomonas sp.]|uniref:DUF2946 family protein n=1 Tax=Hyphomonas sp. TaxID=87 RepID=UPI003D2E5196
MGIRQAGRYRAGMLRGLLLPGAAMRWCIIIAMCLLMITRGLVPTGYMLDRSPEADGILIRICGGFGERMMSLDPHTGKMSRIDADAPAAPAGPHDDDRNATGDTCPYAATSVFALPLSPEAFLAAAFGPPLLGGLPVVNTVSSWRAHAPLPPRGPPVRT